MEGKGFSYQPTHRLYVRDNNISSNSIRRRAQQHFLAGWIQPNPTIIFKYMHINMHHSSNLANGIGVGAKAAAGNVRSRFSFEKTPLSIWGGLGQGEEPKCQTKGKPKRKKGRNKRERLFECSNFLWLGRALMSTHASLWLGLPLMMYSALQYFDAIVLAIIEIQNASKDIL